MAQQIIENQTAFKGIQLPSEKKEGKKYVTSLGLKYDSHLRPTMRASTRWDYLTEYIGFYIDHYRFLLYAIILVIGGILLLNVFAPVALLMIALGAKYKSMSWWDRFIYNDFGKERSLVLMN
ncbi:MAG: hypothetical protein ACP5O3_03910 [Candidatus Micrarchaeia archaeon]|jgi:hypothetical protein